jgi:hypothetical protein
MQPRYWCKHCKVYVRDTKLERTNHDATPRHQGNIKRFLRDLHRGHEKDEKEKDRAKNEVARLKGLVSGTGGESSSSASAAGRLPPPPTKTVATTADRKAQVAQLAEMGIDIPDEFRGDMALPGGWQVTSQHIINPENDEKKPEAIGIGIRKRDPDEVEDEDEKQIKKGKWGSAYKKAQPTEDDDDLDALLSKVTAPKGAPITTDDDTTKKEAELEKTFDGVPIKHEPSVAEEGGLLEPISAVTTETDKVDVKREDGEAAGGIVFKKRKAKNIRQK